MTFTTTEGDVTKDGQLDAADIDFLLAAVARGSVESDLDLNADETVDAMDIDYLVETVFGTRAGDTNLDGRVDFDDFLRLSSNFGKVASWTGGNFDSKTLVDFDDFLIVASNFGFQRATGFASSRPGPVLAQDFSQPGQVLAYKKTGLVDSIWTDH